MIDIFRRKDYLWFMKEIVFSKIILWDNQVEYHGKIIYSFNNLTLSKFKELIDYQGFLKNFKQSIEVKY